MTENAPYLYHRGKLELFCRLCGSKREPSVKANRKERVALEVKIAFGIDIKHDTDGVHPPTVCDGCRSKLTRWKDKINRRRQASPTLTIKLQEFQPHAENCAICWPQPDLDAVTKAARSAGLVATKTSATSVKICRLDPSASKVLCHALVDIQERTIYKLFINDREVPSTNVASVDTLLDVLTNHNICPGNIGFDQVLQSRRRSGCASVLFVGHDGKDVAFQDGNSIRHVNCQGFVNSGICDACNAFRGQLRKYKSRLSGDKVMPSASSHTRNDTLDDEQKNHKMSDLQNSRKSLKRQVKSLEEKFQSCLEKDSVEVSSELSMDMSSIMSSNSLQEGSMQRIFWEQQQQHLQGNNKGFRWHPTMIRLCIALHSKSPAAYECLRKSGVLVLPSKRTLRDYTNFTKPSPGLNATVIERIASECGLHTMPQFQRNVAIAFDEIRIKQGLVYDPNTGELIGWTDTSDVLNEIRRLGDEANPPSLATNIMCFMIRGIFCTLDSVFVYYLSKGFTSYDLAATIWPAVMLVEQAGFVVRALISDGASANVHPRSPPHPLVTLVSNRPDVWPLMLQQLSRIFTTPHPGLEDHVVDMVTPLVKFILLEPQQSSQFTAFRMTLTRLLLFGPKTNPVRDHALSLLISCLPCLQVKTLSEQGEAVVIVGEMCQALLDRGPSQCQQKVLQALVCSALDLANLLASQGSDCSHMIGLLSNLLVDPGLHGKLVLPTSLLLQYGEVLLAAAPACHPRLLTLGIALLGYIKTSSKLVLAALYWPLVQLVSLPQLSSMVTGQDSCPQLLRILLEKLDGCLQHDEGCETEQSFVNFRLSMNATEHEFLIQLCIKSQEDPLTLIDWLKGVTWSLGNEAHSGISQATVGVLVSAFLTGGDSDVRSASQASLVALAKAKPEKSAGLIPVVMWKLGKEKNPKLRVDLLHLLPRLATHKVTVGWVMKTIQGLATHDSLRPTALRLMSSLWQQQDRIYPYLHKMLLESSESQPEMLTAKAATILDICTNRPHQHGEDMLSPLSAIINQCTKDEDVVPATLALRALHALCDAEVIDIRTAWSELSTKLKSDNRSRVRQSLCLLFSVIPGQELDTTEYQEFKEEVLQLLWSWVLCDDEEVVRSAFEALSKFPRSATSVNHLPPQVAADVVMPEPVLTPGEEDEAPPVPGLCFTGLLKIVPKKALPGVEIFLSNLVKDEVNNLPRGVHHASHTRHTRDADRVISGVPDLMQETFLKGSVPAMRPSITAGMLLTYSPEVDRGRDGRPTRIGIIAHGRGFHQMLYTLLNEISMQPNDWQLCMILPGAWNSFMEKCYHAYMQMRLSELEQQLHQGKVRELAQHEIDKKMTWLWARDKLVDLIKSAAKGSPAVQANCVFALTSLVLTVCRHVATLAPENLKTSAEAPEHLSHNHWLSIALHTVTACLDPSFKAPGRIWPIGQTMASQASAASVLAQGAACVASSQLVGIIMSTSSDLVDTHMNALVAGLPGSPDAQHSPVLQFFHGLGLGFYLASLMEENYVEVAGTQGMISLWKSLEALEKVSFGSGKNRLGSLLGLGVCLSAMCNDGQTESRVHITSTHAQLAEALDAADLANADSQGLGISFACLTSAAYSCNLLQVDEASAAVAKLYQLSFDQPQNLGLGVALGMLCHSLQLTGHPSVKDLADKLHSSWLDGTTDQEGSLEERLASQASLMALSGLHSTWHQISLEMEIEDIGLRLQEVVDCSRRLMRMQEEDVHLQSAACWSLAVLYHLHAGQATSKSAVPNSYQYLGEQSLLFALVEAIASAGKDAEFNLDQVKAILRSILAGADQALPPLNWPSLLSPLLRKCSDADVQSLCLKLAAKQSVTAPSAAVLTGAWVVPPLFNSLTVSSRVALYEQLSTLLRSLPAGRLRQFLETSILVELKMHYHGTMDPKQIVASPLGATFLKGLRDALSVPDPPQAVFTVLCDMLQLAYAALPSQPVTTDTIALCECLREVPDDIVDKIMQSEIPSVKSLTLRAWLVANGTQPLQLLNTDLEMFLYHQTGYDSIALCLLLCSLGTKGGDFKHPTICVQWLLELMGHIKNIASGGIDVSVATKSVAEIKMFALQVFSASIMAWSDMKPSRIFGLVPLQSNNEDLACVSRSALAEVTAASLTVVLPYVLQRLLSVEPWKQSTQPVLDWIMDLLDVIPEESYNVIKPLKECAYSLRHHEAFKKMPVWARVLS